MKMLMAVAVALMLAGCGGGSKGGSAGMPSVQTPTTPRPTVRAARLPVLGEPETPTVAVEIPDNTVRITPGQTQEVNVGGRSVSIRCPSGGASCHVGVHEGSLWYRLDGAIPFALANLPSPTPTPTPAPTLTSGSIPAGESRTFQNADGRRTVVTCPAGGPDCAITVAEDGTAEYTGGTPTVTTPTPTPTPGGAIWEFPFGYYPLTSQTLAAGTTIRILSSYPAITSVVYLSCPSGGEACVITVADDGATYTGGKPTVSVWARSGQSPIEGLPVGHTLQSQILAAGASVTTIHDTHRGYYLSCPSRGEPCVIMVADDGTATSTGGTPVLRRSRSALAVTVASVTGYGRWGRRNYGFIATSLVQDDAGARLLFSTAYHRFSPSRGERLTFRGNAYSTDGLTGTINLNYNRGTVDASINDSQSRDLFRMTGVPVDGANFRKVDGTDSLQGSFVRRTDGTGVDRAVGIAATSTRAMAFDIPKR